MARAAFVSAFALVVLGACNTDKTPTTPLATTPTDSLVKPVDSLATPADFPPLVGQIAFTSTRDGSYSIYVAAADRSSLRRLATGVNPAWSRDGQHIAFNEPDPFKGLGCIDSSDYSSGPPLPQDDPRIHVINADGSGERVLSLRGVGPVWSPDGRELAYSTDRGIYVANSDGSNPRQLVSSDLPSSGETMGGPVWSPDGKRIAFLRGHCYDAPFQLHVANADGSGIRALAPYDPDLGSFAPQEWSASWSPDGSRVASETLFLTGPGHRTIGIANVDGSGGRTVATSIQSARTPDWSPDGRILSFTGGSFASGCITKCGTLGTRIYATDPSLGVTIQLVPDAVSPMRRPYDDFQAAWSRVVVP
jgi:Tol biopolymer transport system component